MALALGERLKSELWRSPRSMLSLKSRSDNSGEMTSSITNLDRDLVAWVGEILVAAEKGDK